MDLYLASQSPRRAELLDQLGLVFETIRIDIDETRQQSESISTMVTRLAEEKSVAGWNHAQRVQIKPVLGSDTMVVFEEQGIEKQLSKPESADQAKQYLQLLSGRWHKVITSVAFTLEERTISTQNVSDVLFARLTEHQIVEYVATGEPLDKAGAYGIQGKAAAFIEEMRGSYSSIVGLPLYETLQLYKQITT